MNQAWSIRLYHAADEIVWAIKLNALWMAFVLLSGIALGIGPATLTAYSLARRRCQGESFHVLPAFWHGFRRDFGRGTLLVLPLVATATVLVTNYLYFASLGSKGSAPRLASLTALVVLVIVGAYLLPMTVHYDLRARDRLPKASLVALTRPASSLLLLFVLLAVVYTAKSFPVLGALLAVGGWIQLNTWLCLRFFAENEARLQLKGNS